MEPTLRCDSELVAKENAGGLALRRAQTVPPAGAFPAPQGTRLQNRFSAWETTAAGRRHLCGARRITASALALPHSTDCPPHHEALAVSAVEHRACGDPLAPGGPGPRGFLLGIRAAPPGESPPPAARP